MSKEKPAILIVEDHSLHIGLAAFRMSTTTTAVIEEKTPSLSDLPAIAISNPYPLTFIGEVEKSGKENRRNRRKQKRKKL